ncbi:polyprenyl synthetase family protein [Paenibacillus paridis]|uniref:polyprenyl synthetase family protein n=1 Tax=Paenibacillus paridis TaxID=2583376 RepID=UPI00111E090C|nr:polyprenyl synthetase family protein [Paenibacillus paridis]
MNENALVRAAELDLMLSKVSVELFHIIDSHFHEDSLNQMAKGYVRYKNSETLLWPQLTLYTHYMLGGNSPYIYHAAAQTELIILSLDILDDLQDQDNPLPPWMQIEPAIAMNCASGLLIAAIAGSRGKPMDTTALTLLSTAHNGQHKDIQNLIESEEEYLQLIAEKSASLLNLSIQSAYQLVDEASPLTASILAEFARNVGIAAQLRNDLKGLTDFREHNDIVQRKKTLATLYLLDQSSRLDPFLRNYYEGNVTFRELLAGEQQLTEFITTSGVFEYSTAVQFLYLQQADRILTEITALQPWKLRLRSITIDAFLN